MGPSSPRQVPPQESHTEQIKEKHKVMFKMAKREQRSCSGPSRVRWAAASLARQKPLAEGSLGRWAKPPLRRRRAWRGATRPTAANRLCTCSLGQTQTLASRADARAAQRAGPWGRAASCDRWPYTKGPERGRGSNRGHKAAAPARPRTWG